MNYAICLAPDNPTDKIYQIFDIYKKNKINILFVAKPHTDHQSYRSLMRFYDNFHYYELEEQKKTSPLLFEILEHDITARLNLGILYAYQKNCQEFYLVDLDHETEVNYLFEKSFCKNFLLKPIKTNMYTCFDMVFDPYQPTNTTHIWHRGFPWKNLITRGNFTCHADQLITPIVQVSLINGSTDVDSLGNMFFQPNVNFVIDKPFFSDLFVPFNCQNVLLSRQAIPYYFILPFAGKVGDIIGSYIFQNYHKGKVIYYWPTVTNNNFPIHSIENVQQDLHDQKLIEIFLKTPNNYMEILDSKAMIALQLYRQNFPNTNYQL